MYVIPITTNIEQDTMKPYSKPSLTKLDFKGAGTSVSDTIAGCMTGAALAFFNMGAHLLSDPKHGIHFLKVPPDNNTK